MREFTELLRSSIKFGNIFLGIGRFHLENDIIACCRKYLEESGVENVLVENKIYGPNTVNLVMSGNHYVCGKRGMSTIAEALGHLQPSAFFDQAESDRYKILFDTITEMQSLSEADQLDQELLQQTWERCETEITHLNIKVDQFKHQGCEKKLNILVLEYVC